jgi:hypothetical protein
VRSPLLASLALVACYQSHAVERDAGPLPDLGPMPDTGVVSCDQETIPAYVGPPCSDSVNACRDACPASDGMCRDACLDAPCRTCQFQTLFHCANASGCADLWHTFACCVERVPMCSTLRGFDRTMCATSCPMQFDPYAMCIESHGGVACFMEAAATCHLH